MYIAMLTKKEKEKKSLGYAEPDESVQKILINLIQKIPSLLRQIWSKERKKEPRKENPPKGKGSIYFPSVCRAHSRSTHSSLSLPFV